MICNTLVLSLLTATPVIAGDSAYVGHWGIDSANCAVAGKLAENRPLEIFETELFAHEWSCDFITLEVMPGRAWNAALTGLDMGFVEKFNELWVIDAEDKLHIFDETGVQSQLQRCEVPK